MKCPFQNEKRFQSEISFFKINSMSIPSFKTEVSNEIFPSNRQISHVNPFSDIPKIGG